MQYHFTHQEEHQYRAISVFVCLSSPLYSKIFSYQDQEQDNITELDMEQILAYMPTALGETLCSHNAQILVTTLSLVTQFRDNSQVDWKSGRQASLELLIYFSQGYDESFLFILVLTTGELRANVPPAFFQKLYPI